MQYEKNLLRIKKGTSRHKHVRLETEDAELSTGA
jgi:hypothetical protein